MLAPGVRFLLTRNLRTVMSEFSPGCSVLDVGCGPSSYLAQLGIDPIGLDYSHEYIRQYRKSGHMGVVGSADVLPFQSRTFDSIWTIGVFHHLTDNSVREAVREMTRTCRPGGHVVVAVMPRSGYRRPIAYMLRRLDRGRFMRSENQLLSLLNEAVPLPKTSRRFTFTLNGLEAVACSIQIGQS